jgi:hypothetical protein
MKLSKLRSTLCFLSLFAFIQPAIAINSDQLLHSDLIKSIPFSNPNSSSIKLALHRRQNLQVIVEGEYSQGPTDGGVTVKGKKHRMCGEGYCSEWESISTLKAVRPGVIFRNGEYWCLWSKYNQFLKKTNRTWASCQSEGWSSKYRNN